MWSKGIIIRNKLLYTIANDAVLFGLLVLGYYLLRIFSSPSSLSIFLLIIYFASIFCFYFFRALTVVGEPFDSEGDLSYYILLKLIFLFLNGPCILVFFAKPVLAIPLIGLNTLLISGTQYYRVLLILRGRYLIREGQILSIKRQIAHHGSHYRGFSAIHYVALFEYDNGETISICIDRYTYLRVKAKGYPKAKLACFYFPRGRKYYEIFLTK